MYMDYSKLWKLLIDKGMAKTDLLELTGISSRVLAKLSKKRNGYDRHAGAHLRSP